MHSTSIFHRDIHSACNALVTANSSAAWTGPRRADSLRSQIRHGVFKLKIDGENQIMDETNLLPCDQHGCCSNSLESVNHILFECPAHAQSRKTMIDALDAIPDFPYTNDVEHLCKEHSSMDLQLKVHAIIDKFIASCDRFI